MNEIVFVGSVPAHYFGIQYRDSEYDFDYICYPDTFKKMISGMASSPMRNIRWIKPTDSGLAVGFAVGIPGYSPGIKLEIHEAEFVGRDNPSSKLIFDHIIETGYQSPFHGEETYFANLDTLYMLKMSHRFKKNSAHFLKTMRDIRLMREAGAEIPDETLYQKRMDATYGYKHPNLKRTKEEFFVTTGELVYEYDHDSIHEAVKHLDEPMYRKYAVDGEQVLSDRSKFESLESDRLRNHGVLEEAYVLALERSVIPFGTNPRQAFLMALEKVCTSITSGWFREWAWEHYEECLDIYEETCDDAYVTKFHQAVDSGVAKRVENCV